MGLGLDRAVKELCHSGLTLFSHPLRLLLACQPPHCGRQAGE